MCAGNRRLLLSNLEHWSGLDYLEAAHCRSKHDDGDGGPHERDGSHVVITRSTPHQGLRHRL